MTNISNMTIGKSNGLCYNLKNMHLKYLNTLIAISLGFLVFCGSILPWWGCGLGLLVLVGLILWHYRLQKLERER